MLATLVLCVILIPWAGAGVIWLLGDNRPKAQHAVAVGISMLAALCAILLVLNTQIEIVLSIPVGSFYQAASFKADGLGAFLTLVSAGIGSLTVLFSVAYMHGEKQLGRYYSLILIFIGAMCGIVLSNSLLFLFFFWEITALCSYALISFYNDDPKAVAGGIKALIITQLGGVGLLAGALVIYAHTGSFEIDLFLSEASAFPNTTLALIAFGFLAAAAAKSAQVPFHTWLPDAMEAPTPVSALIHAATMVNAGVYLLARFSPAFFPVPGWKTAVMITGMLTGVMAAVMAVVAVDLKRVLAYSTVSQLGYMVYAIGVGGILASQFHLLSHAIFKALLFLAAGAIIHTIGTRDMRQMGGLGRQMPFVRSVFIIGALALAGIPVLNGFWSKEMILEAGLQGGLAWAFWLMVAGTGITGLYTLRMVWMIFFGRPYVDRQIHGTAPAMKITLAVLAVATLISWTLIEPFSELLSRSFPAGEMHILKLTQLGEEVLGNPATWMVLGIILVGAVIWLVHERLSWLRSGFGWLDKLAKASFGFEWLNQRIVLLCNGAATFLQASQTGILNWNVFGMSAGLMLVIICLTLWK